MMMKNLKLKGVLAIRLLGATIAIMPAQTPANAETSTQSFLEGCRSLVSSSGATTDGAANCQSILEGAIGAFGLLTKEYYPISAQLGYCLEPGITLAKVAKAIVIFADKTPECGNLATFSMCINMALKASYPGSC